jgi:hypothetical protein
MVHDDEVDDDDEVTADPETLARIGVARAELDRGEGLDAAALRDFLGEALSSICTACQDGDHDECDGMVNERPEGRDAQLCTCLHEAYE